MEYKSFLKHSEWQINDIACRYKIFKALMRSYDFVHDMLRDTMNATTDESWDELGPQLVVYNSTAFLLGQGIYMEDE